MTAPPTPLRMGLDGFIWFIGVVENRTDPENLGRVQVRIHGQHNPDTAALPTTGLPWAMVGQDITSAARKSVGTSPTGLAVGSWVWGFFLDGNHMQQPVIVQSFAGRPGGVSDISGLSDGRESIPKGQLPSEPSNTAAPRYPYNTTHTSESGHVLEVDDTPDHERLHAYHRDGTYVELLEGGDAVIRVVGDQYNGTGGKSTIYINGDCNISVGGDCRIQAEGAVTVNSSRSVNIHAPDIEISEQPVSFNAGDPSSVNARNRVD